MMGEMRRAKSLRHEHLDGASDQLLASVAEQLFRLAVDLDDRPVPIDDHDRVGGRFEEALKELVWRIGGEGRPVGRLIRGGRHANPFVPDEVERVAAREL